MNEGLNWIELSPWISEIVRIFSLSMHILVLLDISCVLYMDNSKYLVRGLIIMIVVQHNQFSFHIR